MSIATYIALQSTVGSLLSLTGRTLLKIPVPLQNSINYLYQDDARGLTAVDIRSKVPTAMLNLMAEKLQNHPFKLDRFVLLTPYPPNPHEEGLFRQFYKAIAPELVWQTIEEFARELGVSEEDARQFTDPAAAERLKSADLAARLDPRASRENPAPEAREPSSRPAAAPGRSSCPAGRLGGEVGLSGLPNLASLVAAAEQVIAEGKTPRSRVSGPLASRPDAPEEAGRKIHDILREDREPREPAQRALLHLARKLPLAIIKQFQISRQSEEEFFLIGQSARNAVIVFTDLRNFSTLVRFADKKELNEALYKYYRQAQTMLWDYGGVLDKFIGDSVLAVFNYPLARRDGFENAVRFCVDMIALGREIFTDLTANMDEAVEMGTRAGIATGETWILNIGMEELDISFVGDKINLASRLEQQCEVDGVLMSHLTWKGLAHCSKEFLEQLAPVQRKLPKELVKGQETDIVCWQVGPETVRRLAASMARELVEGGG